ncbi:MAG: Fur family transcriptional regulator [Desulfurivibrionaceae bacterium]
MDTDSPIIRMTKQRKIILEALNKVKSHPTADDLYYMVRDKMAKISLGTVYRNLELLSDAGVIQKINVGGTQKRFDADTSNHPHVRCQDCGRVADLGIKVYDDFKKEAQEKSDFQINGYSLEFKGVCPNCQNQENYTQTP